MNIKRIFLIVLDSFGIGALPDAANYGDTGSNTLAAVENSEKLQIPCLTKMGLFGIDGTNHAKAVTKPIGAYARMAEASAGKDTTTGHWEIAGAITKRPFPTYPDGFPESVLLEFSKKTSYGVLCNKPYSGTQVIRDYGEEHLKTGKLIVYTSGDSVFQIAAHEEMVPVEKLYQICGIAREILHGEHAVGRVIARPFAGSAPDFYRTENRRDFSLKPPENMLLNHISGNGLDVISVGKIYDIFSGCGITEFVLTHNNQEGMEKTKKLLKKDFHGLCFVNLVDFDMLFGHRNDVDGYANALSEFDAWLSDFIPELNPDDMLMITADHGCDPSTPSTDHSREYTPLLIYGNAIQPVNLGTRNTFADIAKTILAIFGIAGEIAGTSFADNILK